MWLYMATYGHTYMSMYACTRAYFFPMNSFMYSLYELIWLHRQWIQRVKVYVRLYTEILVISGPFRPQPWIWLYMAIYGPYIWPYMDHIWPYMAHIWSYMGHIWAIYGPAQLLIQRSCLNKLRTCS